MMKKPALWIVLAALSVGAVVFSWRNFTSAFPLLSLDIRMDRQAALDRAATLAAERRLGPPDARVAASFGLDESVQTFVELEGGGKPAFAALVADRLYTPYRWRVRRFKEREKHEAVFAFAPDGTANGFAERLPEDAPGAALTGSAARAIAEAAAARDWQVDLAPFDAVEQSEERRTGGRIDHTIVYERRGAQLGDGRYRLRLVVSGDRLTELTYFLKVPDAFNRRYENMRAVNTAIGVGGSLAFLVLYGVGGIAIGLFVLMRQRWVLWRQPVFWGSAVAIAQTAARFNEWPLAWMQYDTALSTRSFMARQVSLALAELAGNVALFSLSFMAAESLTRRAFSSHPQFWRLWGRDAGRSREVFGQTMLGYLLVPLFIAYEVVLYRFATTKLGWWSPSEALFNPDVLASYAPWLSAVARSFQAGFWEEALFRAVPIAGAALIGDRVGHRRLFIVLAFAVQAAIFGAGHAPYPTQPSYARPVELVIPSIAFGTLYLVFGLLPGIVLHFAFDAVWFAMPLFASSAQGVRLQQAILVAAVFVPVWMLLARRARAGVADLPPECRNAAWRPEPAASHDVDRRGEPEHVALTASRVRSILAVGAVAAVAWAAVAVVAPIQRHPLETTRTAASNAARTALAPTNLSRAWRFLPVADEPQDESYRFVWETAGRDTYRSLLGTYLEWPGWNVFVRTFEGDVAERAESWTVALDANAAVRGVTHTLPEARAAESLTESAARQTARRVVRERFGVPDASLEEKAVAPSKLPQRTDWTITFKDTSRTLPRGELRLSVRFAGTEVADARRFVFIPEDWERRQRDAQTLATIVGAGGTVLGIVLMVAGGITAIVSWSRRQFSVRLFVIGFAVFFALAAIRFANGFPVTMAALSTAQPLQLQLLVLVGSGLVGLGLQSATLALIAGGVPAWAGPGRLDARVAVRLGIAIGAIAAAARALTGIAGGRGPAWPSYAGAASFVPFVAAAIGPSVTLMTRIAFLLFLVAMANRISAGWTRHRLLVGGLLGLFGGILGTAGSPLAIVPWLASVAAVGAVLVLLYIAVLRHDISVVPLAAAVMTIAGALREGSAMAYPGALTGTIAGVLLMGVIALSWFRALRLAFSAPSASSAGFSSPRAHHANG